MAHFTTNIFPDFGHIVYEEMKRKEEAKQRKTYTPMEVHNARVSMLEAQVNQLLHRLSMAEAEARQAKGRELKLLSYLYQEFNDEAFRLTTLTRLRKLSEEIADGHKTGS